MINKIILLNKKPNSNPLILISIIILIVVSIIIINTESYDTYKLIGIKECNEKCYIKTNLPYNKMNIIKNKPFIIYNNKKYPINNIISKDIYE